MANPTQAWLVYHYCQGTGLANCLSLLCRNIKVEVIDQFTPPERRDEILSRASQFNRVIIEPSIPAEHPGLFARDRLTILPTLGFQGYHPDFSILWTGQRRALPGVAGSSHSMLAYCAFVLGIDLAKTASLYRADVYRACGYFEEWESSRTNLFATFSRHGFDLSEAFIEWSRGGPFMHGTIHPKIGCLRDIAKMILRRLDMEVLETEILPSDNLASFAVLPVYPEIGVRLGITGNYLVKPGKRYELLDFPQYLARSFASYKKTPETVIAHPSNVARLARVKSVIKDLF